MIKRRLIETKAIWEREQMVLPESLQFLNRRRRYIETRIKIPMSVLGNMPCVTFPRVLHQNEMT